MPSAFHMKEPTIITHANKLSLNVVETQRPIISSGPSIRKIEGQTDAQPSFSIGDRAIEVTTDTKYLGLQIDSKLKWDKHIDTLKTKANRSLGLTKYAKKHLSSDVLNKIYRGIFEPCLSYCYSIWGCCSKSKASALQKIQNRAARTETNSQFDASAAPLIQKLGWPTIKIYKTLNLR